MPKESIPAQSPVNTLPVKKPPVALLPTGGFVHGTGVVRDAQRPLLPILVTSSDHCRGRANRHVHDHGHGRDRHDDDTNRRAPNTGDRPSSGRRANR